MKPLIELACCTRDTSFFGFSACSYDKVVCAGRNYDEEEDAHRKQIFSENVKRIEMHNYLHAKGLKSYRLGITPFADMVSIVQTLNVVGIRLGNIP